MIIPAFPSDRQYALMKAFTYNEIVKPCKGTSRGRMDDHNDPGFGERVSR